MSIKLRLILSYFAMLVVPVILSIVAFMMIAGFVIHQKGWDGSFMRNWNLEQRAAEQGRTIFAEVKTIAGKDPQKLADLAELQKLDNQLEMVNTGLIVRSGDQIIYASPRFKGLEMTAELPPFGETGHDDHDPKLIGNRLYMIKQHDFYFTGSQAGSVFLVTDLSPVGDTVRNAFIAMALAVFLILVLTNGILTVIVSRSIVKPLEKLKNAAEQIKEGNLDGEIKYTRKDEIGKLAASFEEMRRQLKKSVEMQFQYENNRKELISSISHDLKTPITAIKGYVEGIRDGVADTPEKMDRYMRTISVKADDLDKMIDELFLFSKLDLKRVPFNFEKVDAVLFFRDCIDELQFDLADKGISLGLTVNFNGPVTIVADREKLKRVLINIMENAAKYMDKKDGMINAELTLFPQQVQVRIADNGKGVSAEALPFVFDSFYRADASRNQTTGGSGLGLAIAKRIIEEHGGTIWMESRENTGTEIYFTLRRG